MLPDIRAVIAAIIAAAGLLMASFGLVATFRVAQEHHASLQTDLAKRGRSVLPDPPVQRVMIIDTPGPHLLPVKSTPPPEPSVAPVPETASATPDPPPRAEPVPVVQVEVAPLAATVPIEAPAPPTAPPIGGPFAPAPLTQTATTREAAEAFGKTERIGAEKARKARAGRIARERKAKHAAQARAKAPASTSQLGVNQFGGGTNLGNSVNQVGGTSRQ